MRKLEIVDNNILRITIDNCIIEIPIKIFSPDGCKDCSFGKMRTCLTDYYKSVSVPCPCSYLDSILGRKIVFDVSKENFKALSKLIVSLYDNTPGIIKKKVIFKRYQE